jgi:hypothetical protein
MVINFIILGSIIEGILGFIVVIISLFVVLGGGTLLLSWIFGVSIGTRHNRSNAIHPNDLPNLFKGIGNLSIKLKDKSIDEINKITSLINNNKYSKLEKLKELNHLKESGILTESELELLKREIING